MSMRDNSSYFLKALVTKLATEEPDREHSNFDNIITHRLAPAIRESLRLKSEVRTVSWKMLSKDGDTRR